MPKKKNEDKRGRRTNLYLYEVDLERLQNLAAYAYANGHRANDSLVVRAAVAVLASSPSPKFLKALEQVSKADQRTKGDEVKNDGSQRRSLKAD
jgi:hypothetical protein